MAQANDALDFDTAVAHLCSPAWNTAETPAETAYAVQVLRVLLPSSRREEGRVALGASPGAVRNITAVLRTPAKIDHKLGHLAVRLLRNLCVRSVPNQTRAAEADGHIVVLSCFARALRFPTNPASPLHAVVTAGPREDARVSLCTPFYGFAVEFLVNFVTGNEDNAQRVWALAFPHIIDLVLRCDNHAAAAAAGALVHNCVTAVPHRMPDLVALFQPLRDRALASATARANSPAVETSLMHTLVSLMREHHTGEKEEERFAWSFNIIRRLMRASMMRHCFDTLGPSLDEIVASADVSFAALQTTFLHIVDAGVGKSAESGGESDLEVFTVPEQGLAFFTELIETAFFKEDGTLLRLIGSIVASIVIINENSNALDDLRLVGVKISVSMLQGIAMKEREADTPAKAPEENMDADVDAISPSATTVVDINEEELRGLKGVMVRLIAVCCDECPKAQNSVRKLHGIPFVMNALSYEKDTTMNPFLREWAVLAVRNLTAANPENAKEISSYELVGVQNDTDLLEKAGLEAFMDSESGRPRLRQKQSPQ